jgi:hypothetical protein
MQYSIVTCYPLAKKNEWLKNFTKGIGSNQVTYKIIITLWDDSSIEDEELAEPLSSF